MTHVGTPQRKLGHLPGHVSGSSHPARFAALTPKELLKRSAASSNVPYSSQQGDASLLEATDIFRTREH